MIIDIKMSWRNIWRNPRRTILTISAIAFASMLLIFMLSFQFGSYDAMIDTAVKVHTGHLQVQEKGYDKKKDMRLVVSDPAAVSKILKKDPGIDVFTFRANTFSLISSEDRTYGVLVVGIDPVREAKVTRLKKLVRRGSYLSKNDTNQAMLGELLANNLKVDIGDELAVLGQGRDGSIAATVVRIKGIFRSGQDEFDRSSVQIPLKYFQEVYAMNGAVHEVVIIVNSLDNVSMIKEMLQMNLQKLNTDHPLVALDWKELMPGLSQGIAMDLISGFIMYLLLVIVVAFSILNTFLMAIFERTREFGVMMAIGTTPGRLTRMLMIESTAMTFLGIVTGIILGCLITYYYQVNGINIAGASEILRHYGISGRLYPRLSLFSAILGPAVVFIITFLAALYPALKVRSLRPVEALTYI
ncbi:ABC transporter permease [Thermodesulfobacteriota bacterium]